MAYDILPRLPDPNTSPEGPGFVSQTLLNNSPGMIHPLNSGASVSVKFSGDYWTITLSYPKLTIAEGATLFPFLNALQGAFSNFYVQLPTSIHPRSGAWAEMPSASAVSLGDQSNQLKVSNWSGTILAAQSDLSPGDFIKLSNRHKVYMVLSVEIVDLNVAVITLSSDILDTAAVASATIEVNDIMFRVRQEGNTPAQTLTADGLYEAITLKLRENIL